ncbi:MAG TPA: TRAM domain-containing protein, partial [Vicinamibacterales bacterium]|nr:TRAM domain-containing protein [Vicinamibacterales bacterium]
MNLTIEKPAAGGRMIARHDGQVVLVSGAIPGERVTARVERSGKGVLYAATESVDEPSPDRRAVDGDPECGGCLYAHIRYERQLALKSDVIADAFTRIGKLSLPERVDVTPSREDGYRMRARLHVRGSRWGFFREGTHDLCDARRTRQLLPESCDALDRLTAVINSLGIDVREIELSENATASERGVSLDMPNAIDVHASSRLAQTGGLTAFGPDGVVHEALTVGGVDVSLRRSVLAFFQGNRYLLATLVNHVVERIPEGAAIVDLYAGAGLFAIGAAASRKARVRAVEGDRVSAADLIANAAAYDAVDALRQPVESFVGSSPKRPDVLIVDPPRTGMSKEALDGVIRLRAPSVI